MIRIALVILTLLSSTAYAELIVRTTAKVTGHAKTTYGSIVPHPADRAEAHKDALAQLQAEGERLKAETPGASHFQLRIVEVMHGQKTLDKGNYATTKMKARIAVHVPQ